MYELFEHTADLGLRVRAADLETLFAEAGRGLFSMVVDDLDQVTPRETRTIELPAGALDYLLFDWLNELLYLCDTQRLVCCEFEVQLGDQGLKAVIRGEPLDPARHRLTHEVKAITYHQLKLEHHPDGWLAEVIVDI
ncbi:MAG: archease [Planctomycetales bacterium]